MNTPICDLVRDYAQSAPHRLHMPGHKGEPLLGMEEYDITEIPGADSLYEAGGIIAESEKNASSLFGCPTYYSTEGSSQCIRAMLYLALLWAKAQGRAPVIWAGRNAHRTFLSGAALLDLSVDWLWPGVGSSYLTCPVSASALDLALSAAPEKPAAIYLTSPDYLGNMQDIAAVADVCHRQGVLLLVDNAHGGYLKFLPSSRHPIDLGADICCDSAHKTLPVLTGGAYLHISPALSPLLQAQAKQALGLFGSTSPSYLILQSLDAANPLLAKEYPRRLAFLLPKIAHLKNRLQEGGWCPCGDEPMKLTLCPKQNGYTGTDLAEALRKDRIECEFADPDFTVFMPSPSTSEATLALLEERLLALPKHPAIAMSPPPSPRPEKVMSLREALLAPSHTLPVDECVGKILAAAPLACPPAVSLLVPGERIEAEHLPSLYYYGTTHCCVVQQ